MDGFRVEIRYTANGNQHVIEATTPADACKAMAWVEHEGGQDVEIINHTIITD